MGYISKDIALITEPETLSLSAVPNFVQFASKPGQKVYLEANIQVRNTEDPYLRITEPDGAIHSFTGTTDPSEVSGPVFFVSSDISDTAENVKRVLLADPWINANFEVLVPFEWNGVSPSNGTTLNLKSKGAGAYYNVQIDTSFALEWINQISTSGDSLSGEEPTAEIALDVYVDADIFLGQDDVPTTPDKIGSYSTTLSKTYAGIPLWFDLNSLFTQYGSFNRPSSGWFDTGTCRVYRFTAKVQAINSYPFYQSNALYVINGYGYPSEELDLEEYAYSGNPVKLLTNKPRTPYVRGQQEYLNFILKDPYRGTPAPADYSLRVAYRVYSTSDAYLGIVYGPEQNRADFHIVNTCQLDLDVVLDQFPTAGIIRVALARGSSLVSNNLEYTIRPDCLHSLRQFSFINRLGGWDTFNFDADLKDEIKPSPSTYNKTITPDYRKGDSIETVYSTALTNTFTVEGAPVTDEVAAWLKELAAARVVLDNDGNYIVIEDFTLSVSEANRNMQKPSIKYHLSENITND